jgi:uncharacterized integral membrane protein
MKKILSLLIACPLAVILVTVAIINRHSVRLALDPVHPEAPLISLTLPFYAFLLGALMLGVLIGGLAAWLNQGRFRRDARIRSHEARRWQAEADRLTRERDDTITAQRAAERPKSLAVAGRG